MAHPPADGPWPPRADKVGDLKSDRVVAVLEQQIFTGALQPGAVLPTEVELGERLGVSRTVVRDAVRNLVARGLLVVRQGRGTIVPEPNDDAFSGAMVALLARSGLSMGEVVRARATVEIMVASIAATSGTEEDWTYLEATYDAFRSAVANRDHEGAASAHTAFHAGILQATHQPALALMLTPVSEIAVVTGAEAVRRNSVEDWHVEVHHPILVALRAGDPEAAAAAVRQHFEVSTTALPYRDSLDRPFAQGYFGRSEPA